MGDHQPSVQEEQLRFPGRVALLTNIIPPYRLSLYRCLQQSIGELRIYLSQTMESNRAWPVEWKDLPVVIQRTVTLRRTWRHPGGFAEAMDLHLPLDTLALLRRFRPAVVISAEMGLRSLQAAWYCRRPGCRWVVWATVSERTEQGRGLLRRSLRRWLLSRADAVLVNGESGFRYVRSFRIDKKKICRVPYTTDNDPFLSIPQWEDNPENIHRLLFVGQLVDRKGLKQFLPVLCRWLEEHPERRVRLVVVGDGPLRPWLESLKAPTNLSLQFAGNQPYERLPSYYAQADALVFPTLADEWGLVVNEALAAGVPILGSIHSQAVEELVDEGRQGWTFNPEKEANIYQAIERAFSTPGDELKKMRKAARERIAQVTPEEATRRILDVLDSVSSRP